MLLQYFYIFAFSVNCCKAQALFQTVKFLKETAFNTQNKTDNGCITLHDGQVSELDCARECSNSVSCEGFSQNEEKSCYIHSNCDKSGTSAFEFTSKSSLNLGLKFYARRVRETCCLNGGVWNPEAEGCQCSQGMVGPCCERYPESCNELREYGYGLDVKDNYYLHPPEYSTPFFTRCTLLEDETRIDIAHVRREKDLNFNRTWDEYVNGFRDSKSGPSFGFWIGLKHLEYLTRKQNLRQMRMRISLTKKKAGINYVYKGVQLGNETEQFEFHYESVSTIIGNNLPQSFTPLNCFESKSGLKFSTPDVDNDNDDNVHCAKLAGAGWWFGTCSPNPRCNPFGIPCITGDEEFTPERMFFEGMNISDFAKDFEDIRLYLIDPL